MKAFYYCPEYYYDHGGRTHAREFYKALALLPEVETVTHYPLSSEHANFSGKKRRLNPVLLLPKLLREFARCFIPRYGLTAELCDEIKREKCDSLILRTGGRRLVLIGQIKKKCPGVVICLEINAAIFEEEFATIPFRRFWQYLEVQRFQQADVISVVSSHLKQYLVDRGISSKKIIVNPNGVNAELFSGALPDQRINMREKLSIPNDAIVVGYVGGMEGFRRLPEVVDRMAGLRKQVSEKLFFVIVGDGEDRNRVEESINKNEKICGEWVRIKEWVPYDEIPKLMATFDIACFPFSNAYGSPMKLFEYMAMEIPTVGPDVPSVVEIFKNGEHLRLVSQDGANFENVFVELIASKDERRSMAYRGKMLVLSSYTWNKNAQRIVKKMQAFSEESVSERV